LADLPSVVCVGFIFQLLMECGRDNSRTVQV
jgi:hypothetical protein